MNVVLCWVLKKKYGVFVDDNFCFCVDEEEKYVKGGWEWIFGGVLWFVNIEIE